MATTPDREYTPYSPDPLRPSLDGRWRSWADKQPRPNRTAVQMPRKWNGPNPKEAARLSGSWLE